MFDGLAIVRFPAPKVAKHEFEFAKFGVIVPPALCVPQEAELSGVTACPAVNTFAALVCAPGEQVKTPAVESALTKLLAEHVKV